MSYVYFVVPDLGYGSHGRQVSLLAPGMNRSGWTAGVYSLAGDASFGPAIRVNSVSVEQHLGSAGRDYRSWVVLRPKIPLPGRGTVHAFGLRVLRRLMVASFGTRRPRIVLSLTGRERLTWFDRRCLRGVARIVVPHFAAAEALVRQGAASANIAVGPLAVAAAPPPPDRAEFCRANGLPANAKIILTAGSMNERESLFDAVCAFEFLRYVDDAVHLVMVGEGPGRAFTESTARRLAPEGTRVHFLGARTDVPAVLGLADFVLVAQPAGGANVALEAMAAGRPVIVFNTPDLSAVVRDGESGVVVPARDTPAMARAMRRVLDDPDLRLRLGDAARRYALEQHSVERVVRTLVAIYQD